MNLAQNLIKADKKSPKNILIVGDAMVDVYIHGKTYGTCQESCMKFVEESRYVVPGGAANAARSLSYWMVRIIFPPNRLSSTPTKTRFMVGDRCVFRHDNDRVDTYNIDSVRAESLVYAQNADAVLLSDYDKGILTPEFIKDIVEICKKANIPCVVDCKRPPELYEGCILKGNVEWLNRYKPNMMTPQVVITNGWDGPTVSGRMVSINQSRVHCINHVGAGDCFAAHLALALAYGFDLFNAAAIAHSAGRVYVQYRHNRPPRPEEIAADMDECLNPTCAVGSE